MKKIIVIGGLNIDFFGLGVNKIVGKGELSYLCITMNKGLFLTEDLYKNK